MQKFELVIKNEKEKLYTLFSWIVIIINIVIFILIDAYNNFNSLSMVIYAGIVIAAIIIPRYFKNRKEKTGFTASFFIIIIGWVSTKYWWVGFIVLLLFVLDIIVRRKLIVSVNEERIIYPSFPVKEIKWFELSNLILKDRLLSIDFKNNKLYQHEIINDENEIDEKEFNEFCKEQLNKSELYKYN